MDNLGEVRISTHLPAATIHYAEAGGRYDFSAELGTGKTLLYIYAPA